MGLWSDRRRKNLFDVAFVRVAPFYGVRDMHPQDRMWPMPTLYAATMLKERGFGVHVLDTWAQSTISRDDISNWIRESGARLVFLESMTQTADVYYEVVGRIRSDFPDLPIWGMGQHASAMTKHLFAETSSFDGAVIRELEHTVVQVAEALRDERAPDLSIPGVALGDGKGGMLRAEERPFDWDLDQLPFPDVSLIDIPSYYIISSHVRTFKPLRWGFLMTSRGCPYPCTYCSQTLRQSFGLQFRGMSPERVVDDMERLEKEHGVNAIFCQDDVFTFDMDRVRAICDEYLRRELTVRWVCQTRGDALDRDLVQRMKRAGCAGVTFGVESGNDRVLRVLKKKETAAEMFEGARLVKEAGLALTCYYMIGNPTETREEVLETLGFAKKVGSHVIQCAYFTPYPGSPFFEDHGDEIEHSLGDLSHYNSMRFNYSEIDDEELRKLQRRFYLEYLLSPKQVLRYVTQRAPYAIFNNGELGLIGKSLKFFLAA